MRKRRRTMHACEGGLAYYLVALRKPKTLHSRARNVSPPSHRRALEPRLQERADARERATALWYDACVEVPRMRHARPHFDFDLASRGFEFLGHADRVVAQDLVAAHVDQRRRQPGRIAVKRRGVMIARIGTFLQQRL